MYDVNHEHPYSFLDKHKYSNKEHLTFFTQYVDKLLSLTCNPVTQCKCIMSYNDSEISIYIKKHLSKTMLDFYFLDTSVRKKRYLYGIIIYISLIIQIINII